MTVTLDPAGGPPDGPDAPPDLDATDDIAENRRSARAQLGYQPALDGLRGLALLAIFVYHAGFDWAPGAFLSVSTFFTLSGFLITFLLLGEFSDTGRINRGSFWGRRFRRLLPASLVAIGGIVIAAYFFGDLSQLSRLRGDVVACLAYVANWRFIIAGDSYGAMFTTKSPMQHFWSLAIEEQFYLFYPLLFGGLLALGRGSKRVIGIAFVVLIAVSLGAGIVMLNGGAPLDRLYFGTDFRAPELLVGGLLALWWSRRDRIGVAWPDTSRGRQGVVIGGVVAFVAMIVLWNRAVRTDLIWYHGGLTLYALLTGTVIVAALQPNGPVRRVLASRPIVAIGLISYGAYLIHWPVFVWLDSDTGLSPLPLFAARVAVTLALATASYFLVEKPIRQRRVPRNWNVVLAPVAIIAILAGVFAVTRNAKSADIDFEDARRELAARTSAATLPPGAAGLTPDQVAGIEAIEKAKAGQPAATGLRMGVFGDSSALMMGLGMTKYTSEHGDVLTSVGGWAELGCGTLTVSRMYKGVVATYPDQCRDWVNEWGLIADANHPEVALVELGPWEVADTQLPGSERYTHLGDPALDDAVRAKLTEGVDVLLARGAKVVLLTSPPIETGRSNGVRPSTEAPESDPVRMARFNEIQREVAASRPNVTVVDYAAHIASLGDDDLRLRPDGIHPTWDTAGEISEWLGPEIARAVAALPSPPRSVPVPTR